MRLPVAPNAYDRQNEQQARFQVEQEDARNLKSDQDIKLAQGAKVFVRSPDGTYREVLISNTGVVTGTGWTAASERVGLGFAAALDGLWTAGSVSAARSALAVNPIDNRFINGDNQIDQRNAGAAQTITAGAALAYTIDRWYAYCTGANVTGQRVTGSGADLFRYQFTGAASVTKIGFATRIEARDCADLAGGSATLAVELANSLLTTVTWTAWYANSTDTFGTLASPTRTQIATGTFTVSSTLTTYTTTISVPAAATTGIEVEFSVAAQTSGTWTIGKRAIVKGSVWPGFCPRPFAQELTLCQRYFYRMGGAANFDFFGHGFCVATNQVDLAVQYPVPMRAIPSLTVGSTTGLAVNDGTTASTSTGIALSAAINNTVNVANVAITGLVGMTTGRAARVNANSTTNGWLAFSAEL